MNRRNTLHFVLYLVALVLAFVMIVPAITTAQGGARGWIQQGDGDVYVTGGRVGIGDEPVELDGKETQLQVMSGKEGGNAGMALLFDRQRGEYRNDIYLGERKEEGRFWGFDIRYDSKENVYRHPNVEIGSGLFGIWRVEDDMEEEPDPVFSIYRHINTVGIGIKPEDLDSNISLRVLKTIKLDDGEFDEDEKGRPLPGVGENNYALFSLYKPSANQPDILAIRSYGSYEGQSIRLQQQIGPDTYDRLVIEPDGEVCIGSCGSE